MKTTSWISSFLILVAGTWSGFAQDAAGLYGRQIVVQTDAADNVKYMEKLHGGMVSMRDTAEDLGRWLEKVSGTKFDIRAASAGNPATGIFLMLTNSPLAAPADVERLKNRGKEAFVIRSEGNTRLWITGNSKRAVQDGAYTYLDRLGCRWYFPNDHWKIAPSLHSITLKIDQVDAPAFRDRDFGGTGGFGGSLAVDPQRKMEARWEVEWKSFNRMGGDIVLHGHTGEAFNMACKKEMLAHPEYLAEIGGKRQPWTDITKLCVSNPEVRKLYIDWTLERFKQSYDADPNGREGWGVSVEPADGSGQCECAECNKIGNGSSTDKVFFMANAVARVMTKTYPGKEVSLLAYNDHAMVPSIPLETNILVWVTPYGFNRTGLTGDELLQAWGKKCRELGLYDYWSIPDWSQCKPDMNYLETVPAKIRFWRANSVTAFNCESSYSAGNVGVVWYLASRLLWNPAANVHELLEDFYQKSFGPAAVPMRRMLERWCTSFTMTGQELGLSFRDLQEASRLATDDATRARIDDFVLYVQYLRLWYEYRYRDMQPKQTDSRDYAAATDALLKYCWRIYNSAMVHSYRMAILIMNRYEHGEVSKQLNEKWPLYDATAEIWKTIKPVTGEEMNRFVLDGVRDFKPVEYEARTYSEKLVPLTPLARSWRPGADWVTTPVLACDQDCLFWAPEGVPQIEIRFMCGGSATLEDKITVFDPSGQAAFRQTIPADRSWRTLAIPTRSPGLYRLHVLDLKSTFCMKVPSNLPFVLKNTFVSPDLSTKVYFFVPKGLKRFAMYAEGAIPFTLFDPTETPGKNKVNGFIVANVPPDMDGRAWAFAGLKCWDPPFQAINFPPLFALTPGGLLVPEEVAARSVRSK